MNFTKLKDKQVKPLFLSVEKHMCYVFEYIIHTKKNMTDKQFNDHKDSCLECDEMEREVSWLFTDQDLNHSVKIIKAKETSAKAFAELAEKLPEILEELGLSDKAKENLGLTKPTDPNQIN